MELQLGRIPILQPPQFSLPMVSIDQVDGLRSDAVDESSFYMLEAEDIHGNLVSFSQFKGKVVLVVNTASRCGFTPQYHELEGIYRRFGRRGLVVLAFPCNDFGGQEPDSNRAISHFNELNYGITFPVFSKISIAGSNPHPVYRYLTLEQPLESTRLPVAWNFTKFLLDSRGYVVGYFPSRVRPTNKAIIEAIERILPVPPARFDLRRTWSTRAAAS